MELVLSEQERIRRENLQKIRELQIDPYPAALYPVDATASDIKKHFEQNPDDYSHVCLAGRLMMVRVMGKASFAEILDHTGKIQVYINRDEICPGEDKEFYNTFFKKLLDLT